MTSLMRSVESYLNNRVANCVEAPLFAYQPSEQAATHGVLHLIEPQHAARHTLEQFIAEGFSRHYQANVQHFMPHLLGVLLSEQWQAVLGIRFATEGRLFTEQYLTLNAEQALQQQNIKCQRADIAEIGHLYAQSRSALMQLFVLMVQALHQLDVKQLLFSATSDLKRLLRRHGISLLELASANPECLGDKAKDWGSYYQSQPDVCVLSVTQAAQRIQADPRLQQLIFRHWPQLHALVDTLMEAKL